RRLASIKERHPALSKTEHPHIDAFRMYGPDGELLNTFTDTQARPAFSIEHRSPGAHLLVALNSLDTDRDLITPATPNAADWILVADSMVPEAPEGRDHSASGGAVHLPARSVKVLEWRST
ncbi:MAG: hypothetical protein AAFQ84_01595, partial [Pseudomonadota bacterium]